MSQLNEISQYCKSGTQIGEFIGLDEGGHPLVIVEGLNSPLIALTAITVNQCISNYIGQSVLLWVDDAENNRPIIIGFISDQFEEFESKSNNEMTTFSESTLTIDGKQVNLEGKKEIILKCGHSSITLSQNGKISIKGKNIINRSSGNYRVKGANLNFN